MVDLVEPDVAPNPLHRELQEVIKEKPTRIFHPGWSWPSSCHGRPRLSAEALAS